MLLRLESDKYLIINSFYINSFYKQSIQSRFLRLPSRCLFFGTVFDSRLVKTQEFRLLTVNEIKFDFRFVSSSFVQFASIIKSNKIKKRCKTRFVCEKRN